MFHNGLRFRSDNDGARMPRKERMYTDENEVMRLPGEYRTRSKEF